jgi:hypothetical protein
VLNSDTRRKEALRELSLPAIGCWHGPIILWAEVNGFNGAV